MATSGGINFNDDDIDPDLDIDNIEGDMSGSFEDLPPESADFDTFEFDNVVEAPDDSPIVVTKEDLDSLEKNLEKIVDRELKKIQREANKESSELKKATSKENRREIQDEKRATRREKKTLTNRATRRRTDIRSDASSAKAAIYSLSAAMGLPGYVIANVVDRLFISPAEELDLDAEQSYTDQLNEFFNDTEDEVIQKQRDLEDERDSITPASIDREAVKEFVEGKGFKPDTTPTSKAPSKKTNASNIPAPNNNPTPAPVSSTNPVTNPTSTPTPTPTNPPNVTPPADTAQSLRDELNRLVGLSQTEGHGKYEEEFDAARKKLNDLLGKPHDFHNPDPVTNPTSNSIPSPVTNPPQNTVPPVQPPSGQVPSRQVVPPTTQTPPTNSGSGSIPPTTPPNTTSSSGNPGSGPPSIPTRTFNPASVAAGATILTGAIKGSQIVNDAVKNVGAGTRDSVKSYFNDSPINYMAGSVDKASSVVNPLGTRFDIELVNQAVQLFATSVEEFGKYTDKDKAFSPETLGVSVEGSINKLVKNIEIAERTDSTKAALKDQLQQLDLIWADFKANFFNTFVPALNFILMQIVGILKVIKIILETIQAVALGLASQIPVIGPILMKMLRLLSKPSNPLTSKLSKELEAFHNPMNQPIAPSKIINRR
jgi:uncharacterized membrane protein